MKNQSNDSQFYNIKLGSLNVCGLKRRLEYPDFTKYFENSDILCFMETMLDDSDIISLPGFRTISQPRKRKHFRKSGGLAVLIKDRSAEFCKHIDTTTDYISWLSLNKSLTNTEENVITGVIYVPPTQSKFFNDEELTNLENEIISMCSNYKHVFITGDFNARTSHLNGFTICTAESFYFLHEFEVKELDQLFSDGHTLLSWSLSANVTSSPVVINKLSEGINFKWSDDAKYNFLTVLICRKFTVLMKNS